MTKTVVVTGGCGYIGSHVNRAFKNAGYRVCVVDRVVRPHTLKDVDLFLKADFSSGGALNIINQHRPSVVVHCAGTSLVAPSMTNPGEYYDNNIAKTVYMLNAIRNMDHRPVILFSSSASVYGEPASVPIPDTAPLMPISPYGATKAMTERILSDFFNAHQIPSVCFRYFNAAGAEPFSKDLGQEPGATHIVARILESAINNQEFTMYGTDYPTPDGTCIRDYVHVWDLATAHVQAASYAMAKPGAHVFNLGTGQGVSNGEIVKYVTEKYGLQNLNIAARRPGDPAQLVADVSRAKLELQWSPRHSDMKNIVDSAYAWYTNEL